MPIIEMHLLVGRSTDQKRRAASAITAAVCGALDVKPEQVRILITEHGAEEFAVGGVTVGERQQDQAVVATNGGKS